MWQAISQGEEAQGLVLYAVIVRGFSDGSVMERLKVYGIPTKRILFG